MKEIYLTQGETAIVDDEDFEEMNLFKWCLCRARNLKYAIRTERGLNQFMHRIIMIPPEGMHIDHINGNGLDNRRENLRVCSNAENHQNIRWNKRNTTGFLGVSKRPWGFAAQIQVGKVKKYLGMFDTAEEAHRVYIDASRRLRGEFSGV